MLHPSKLSQITENIQKTMAILPEGILEMGHISKTSLMAAIFSLQNALKITESSSSIEHGAKTPVFREPWFLSLGPQWKNLCVSDTAKGFNSAEASWKTEMVPVPRLSGPWKELPCTFTGLLRMEAPQ